MEHSRVGFAGRISEKAYNAISNAEKKLITLIDSLRSSAKMPFLHHGFCQLQGVPKNHGISQLIGLAKRHGIHLEEEILRLVPIIQVRPRKRYWSEMALNGHSPRRKRWSDWRYADLR